MNPKLLDVMRAVYEKAVFSVESNQPCVVSPEEFRGLLRFFVLVNMNETVRQCGILPQNVTAPEALIDELSESLVGLSGKLATAAAHMNERTKNGKDVN